MRPSVILFDHVYDSILSDMKITKDDIHFEVRKFLTDAIYDHPWDIYADPDYHQESWIKTMDWSQQHHQLEIFQNMKEYDYQYIKDLSKSKRDWFMFFSGASTIWQYTVSCTHISDDLRKQTKEKYKNNQATVDWNTKNTQQDWKSIVLEKCPLLVEFVNQLPFETRGLVQIMGITPGQHVLKHRDIMDCGKRVVDNIMLSFMPDNMPKHLILYDQNDRPTKHKVKALWFDENTYHSTDPLPYFCYSVKIDGVFDYKKLKELGIDI